MGLFVFSCVGGALIAYHDDNEEAGELRGGLWVGLLQLQGPQHGGAERPHVPAPEGLSGRQGRPGGAGCVLQETTC